MHPLRASTFVLLILVLTAMLDPTMAMAGSNRASSSTGKTSAKSRLWTNIKRILYGRPVERPQATILPYIENIMQKHDWEKFKAVWDEAVKNKWLDDHIDVPRGRRIESHRTDEEKDAISFIENTLEPYIEELARNLQADDPEEALKGV